jgi:hypothetical protein
VGAVAIPLLLSGKVSITSCSAAEVPAETWISISSGPVKDPAEGAKLARPFPSLRTLLWLALRITGIPEMPELPVAGIKSFAIGRDRVD